MRRRGGGIEAFSISALDLFASAMGAFALITIILLPYYRMVSEVPGSADAIRYSYLGIETDADSFIILMDLSGSMDEHRPDLTQTLSNLIGSMEVDKSLQVIAFQGDGGADSLREWQPPRTLQAMSTEARADASTWVAVRSLETSGRTPTFTALEEALFYEVEAIMLVSDGAPTDRLWPDLVEEISDLNGGRKEIHSVAVGRFNKESDFAQFMIDLAARNDGNFVAVTGR